MAAKKPAAKAKKAKKTVAKTVSKKVEPAKKVATGRKPVGTTQAKSALKPKVAAPAKPSKAATQASAPKVSAPPKSEPVKAATKIEVKSPVKSAVKPLPATSAPHDKVRNADSLISSADEESDAPDAGSNSLLSGPRNVKPYIPKRGEQYMNKEQLEHFQQILLSWKRDLMEEVDRTVLHMKDEAANFPDPNDRATQESEFSLELRTRDRERKLIRKIDEALKRIEDGTYGYCNETGEEIGIKRLEARPVATLSVEAQERRERREKQYGDRDDRYR